MKKLDAILAVCLIGQGGLDLSALADQDDLDIGIGGNRLHRAGDDRARRMIAAHRVQRDTHGSLLLFHRHDFPALIVAAIRADAVWQHRLIALGAILNLERLDV